MRFEDRIHAAGRLHCRCRSSADAASLQIRVLHILQLNNKALLTYLHTYLHKPIIDDNEGRIEKIHVI